MEAFTRRDAWLICSIALAQGWALVGMLADERWIALYSVVMGVLWLCLAALWLSMGRR